MNANQIDFTAAMDNVWNMLNQLTQLADSLERSKRITPAHVEMSCTVSDALKAAYMKVREEGDFTCIAAVAA